MRQRKECQLRLARGLIRGNTDDRLEFALCIGNPRQFQQRSTNHNIGGSESFIVDANEGDVFVCEYKRTQFRGPPPFQYHLEAGGGKVWVTDTHSGRTTVMMAKVDDSTQAANGDDDAQIENVGWKAVGSVTAA